MGELKKYLHLYINDPLDPYINAQLGEEYDKLGQGAAALSYFLRAAELLYDKDPSPPVSDTDMAFLASAESTNVPPRVGAPVKLENALSCLA